MSDAKPRRLWLIVPWALFIALALGWTIYWNVLAHGARTALNAAIAQQERAGATAEIGAVRTRGFPLQLALDIAGARYITREQGLRFETAHLLIHINPINPSHVIATFPAPVTFAIGPTARQLASSSLTASAKVAGDGLSYIGVEAHNLIVVKGTRTDRLQRFVMNLRPDPRDDASWQAALHIEGWTLDALVGGMEPLGQDISTLDAAIVLERARAAESLGAWRADGAGARVEALQFVWGAAQGRAQGRVTLDDEERLAGALNVSLVEPRRTIAAFAAAPDTSRDTARALDQLAVASALAGDTLSLPMRAENGELYLGQARIRSLQPLL